MKIQKINLTLKFFIILFKLSEPYLKLFKKSISIFLIFPISSLINIFQSYHQLGLLPKFKKVLQNLKVWRQPDWEDKRLFSRLFWKLIFSYFTDSIQDQCPAISFKSTNINITNIKFNESLKLNGIHQRWRVLWFSRLIFVREKIL